MRLAELASPGLAMSRQNTRHVLREEGVRTDSLPHVFDVECLASFSELLRVIQLWVVAEARLAWLTVFQRIEAGFFALVVQVR